jgi:3-dehydroquinate dehydratase-2
MDTSILIVNGPGLGDLADYERVGHRDLTLPALHAACEKLCSELGIRLDFRQTDDQQEMSEWLARESARFDGVIVNPVGYSRAATLDSGPYRSAIKAMAGSRKPVIEVHIDNIYGPGADAPRPLHQPAGDMGFICGLGINGYLLAIRSLHKRFDTDGRD